jgi:phosphoglycerate dehydrogenase-like enzyme
MRVLFLNRFNDYWKSKYSQLKEEFPEVDFKAEHDPCKRLNALKKADAVISGRLSESEIRQAEMLKVIFVPFTGLDNFPLEVIKKNNILISNTHANAEYVAERAVMLCLALLGRAVDFHNDLKQGKWNRSSEANNMWITIQNKTCSIIGFGNIGKFIAKYLKAFGCTVIGFKKNPEIIREGYANEISGDLFYVIAQSDVIFVSLPLTNETKGLLNSDLLMKMNGKYLINVGRGETVDEEGLYNSLKNGILKGAALDVWYKYPGKQEEPVYPASKPFWELPNVILSPHKSSQTIEAVNAMIDDTVENIKSYIKTGVPKNTASFN